MTLADGRTTVAADPRPSTLPVVELNDMVTRQAKDVCQRVRRGLRYLHDVAPDQG